MARPLSPRTSPTQVGAIPPTSGCGLSSTPKKSQRRGPLRNRAVCNRLALLSGWS